MPLPHTFQCRLQIIISNNFFFFFLPLKKHSYKLQEINLDPSISSQVKINLKISIACLLLVFPPANFLGGWRNFPSLPGLDRLFLFSYCTHRNCKCVPMKKSFISKIPKLHILLLTYIYPTTRLIII